MKKLVFVLVFLIFILSGCSGSVRIPETQAQYGRLSLAISTADAAGQTLIPDWDMTVEVYDLYGIGPANATFEKKGLKDATKVEIGQLQAGQWTFIAKAKNKKGDEIAAGDAQVTVEANKTAKAQITVSPLEGSGTLQVNLSWPKEKLEEPVVVATLGPIGQTPESIDFTLGEDGHSASYENMDLAAGYYLLTIELQEDGEIVGNETEAVRIIKDQTTAGDYKMEICLEDIVLQELGDDWIFHYITSGLARGEVINGEIAVTVDELPDNCWDIQITKGDLLLEEGYIYVFSFDARADHERYLGLDIDGGEEQNWYCYGSSDPIINTEMRTYYTIANMAETIETGRLVVSYGHDFGTVYIDNIRFERFPASEADSFPWIPPFPVGIELGPELVQNGDFTDGINSWSFDIWSEGPQAEWEIIDGEFFVNVITKGEKWDIQFFNQSNISLERGSVYLLSFDARADRVRFLGTGVRIGEEYSIGFHPKSIIGTKIRTYLGLLYIPVTADNWSLGITYGDEIGEVYIDNISLRKLIW